MVWSHPPFSSEFSCLVSFSHQARAFRRGYRLGQTQILTRKCCVIGLVCRRNGQGVVSRSRRAEQRPWPSQPHGPERSALRRHDTINHRTGQCDGADWAHGGPCPGRCLARHWPGVVAMLICSTGLAPVHRHRHHDRFATLVTSTPAVVSRSLTSLNDDKAACGTADNAQRRDTQYNIPPTEQRLRVRSLQKWGQRPPPPPPISGGHIRRRRGTDCRRHRGREDGDRRRRRRGGCGRANNGR